MGLFIASGCAQRPDPAHRDGASDAQIASAAKLLIEAEISLAGLVRIVLRAADLNINTDAP